MFIFELIGKLLETFLSEPFKVVFARQHGARRFARELLRLYESIDGYIIDCKQFAETMDRDREFAPSRRISPQTAKELRWLADRMGAALRSLFNHIGREFHRAHMGEEARDNRSRRTRTILEVLDPDLATIMDDVYNDELGLMLSLDLVTYRLLDLSHISVPPDLIPVGDQKALEKFEQDRLVTTVDLRDDVQFERLRQSLMRSVDEALKLKEAIGAHLRTRYAIEDLL